METKNQQGPFAFPQKYDSNKFHSDYNGMMLRDYFAAKAMQGHMASEYGVGANCDCNNMDALASVYYSMADAMLKQREL